MKLIVALAVLSSATAALTATPAQAAPPKEKTYTVSFDKTPWADVFDWFSKESGLTFIDTVKPVGTLTLKKAGKYTLPQLVDLLNEALVAEKMILIRRSQTFLVHPADERIPPEIVQMITLEELSSRGDTEVVQVVIPMPKMIAEDIAAQIKELLSKYGTASAFGSDQLIILDKARNIRDIVKFIDTSSNPPATPCCNYQLPAAESVSHPLRGRFFSRSPSRCR